jgi:hypothetical protein
VWVGNSRSSQDFLRPSYRVFCLLVYPLNWNSDSLNNNILFKTSRLAKMLSSGTRQRVALVGADVSEERIASIITSYVTVINRHRVVDTSDITANYPPAALHSPTNTCNVSLSHLPTMTDSAAFCEQIKSNRDRSCAPPWPRCQMLNIVTC